MANLPSPCGVNEALNEAKAQIDILKAKIANGLDSVADLSAISATIKAKLSEVNVPQVPNINLQSELAALPYLTPEEYTAKVAELKRIFGSSVPDLDKYIDAIPKPPGLSSSTSNLYEQLQNLAANITTTTQDILNSLTPEAIGAAIADMCKDVPNKEVQVVLDDNQNPVLDDQGDVVTTTPIEKPTPPVTPQKNPTKEETPPPTKRVMPAKWTSDSAFIAKVKSTAATLNCSVKDLLACMAFETGRTFDPSLKNFIGATGLIQFIESTAKGLGTTTAKLATMTREEQMDYVLKYFKAGPVAKVSAPKLEDLYMQILWPKAVGKPDTYILFEAPSKAYEQNKGLDKTKKGYVTKADAAAKVTAQLQYINDQLSSAKITV